jgi:hypothetical protein
LLANVGHGDSELMQFLLVNQLISVTFYNVCSLSLKLRMTRMMSEGWIHYRLHAPHISKGCWSSPNTCNILLREIELHQQHPMRSSTPLRNVLLAISSKRLTHVRLGMDDTGSSRAMNSRKIKSVEIVTCFTIGRNPSFKYRGRNLYLSDKELTETSCTKPSHPQIKPLSLNRRIRCACCALGSLGSWIGFATDSSACA